MKLRVHMLEPEVTSLGFGKRFTIWVQGCNRRCPGCVSPEAQLLDGAREVETAAIAWEIILSGADGVTISGGEPMLQAEALTEIIRTVKSKRDIGVIIYTGYMIDELTGGWQKELLSMTDLLIDGEYIAERDDGKALRGSDNQRLIFLTDRYRDEAAKYADKERDSEKRDYGIEKREIGIPAKKNKKGDC